MSFWLTSLQMDELESTSSQKPNDEPLQHSVTCGGLGGGHVLAILAVVGFWRWSNYKSIIFSGRNTSESLHSSHRRRCVVYTKLPSLPPSLSSDTLPPSLPLAPSLLLQRRWLEYLYTGRTAIPPQFARSARSCKEHLLPGPGKRPGYLFGGRFADTDRSVAGSNIRIRRNR
jgi:hypothetical protein